MVQKVATLPLHSVAERKGGGMCIAACCLVHAKDGGGQGQWLGQYIALH